MSLYSLKPKFRHLLSGLTYQLWLKDITPNQITLTAIFSSIAFGIGILLHPIFFLFFPLFVFLRMALNAIDGLMASTYNMKSQTGFILNEAGDIISDMALYLPFVFFIPLWAFVAFIVLTILTEIMGLLGLRISHIRHYHGPLGKSDRVFVMSFLALFIYFTGHIFLSGWIFSLINIGLIITIYQRWRANYV